MKIEKLERFAPPGFPIKKELNLFAKSLIPGILFSCTFFIRYQNHYKNVAEVWRSAEYGTFPAEDYRMPSFASLLETSLGSTFFLFGVSFALVFGIMVYHYISYFQGSKSIYVMKCLPNKREWHVRAMTMPLLEVLVIFAVIGTLWLTFWAFYYLKTPTEWIR